MLISPSLRYSLSIILLLQYFHVIRIPYGPRVNIRGTRSNKRPWWYGPTAHPCASKPWFDLKLKVCCQYSDFFHISICAFVNSGARSLAILRWRLCMSSRKASSSSLSIYALVTVCYCEVSDHEGGDQNVMQEPLVEPVKVLLPLLHIKLGLIKQFVKQLEPESEASGVGSQRAPKTKAGKRVFQSCLRVSGHPR